MGAMLRIYLDTSVIGGCFDEEFKSSSLALFSLFEKGAFIPILSELTLGEIENAPEKVKKLLLSLKKPEIVTITKEMEELATKYINQQVVSKKYAGDALHIATATIIEAHVLVSWNFKHIVNLQKIHQFNGINAKEGYKTLEIRTPQEVIAA